MSKSNIPQSQLDAYAAFIKADYASWMTRRGKITDDPIINGMIAEFQIGFEIGSSYIKTVKMSNGQSQSVHSFIVNKDGKFPKGAILKSAGWKAPATNFLRANIDKPEGWAGSIAWTGAH
jgi:hypothetical protein